MALVYLASFIRASGAPEQKKGRSVGKGLKEKLTESLHYRTQGKGKQPSVGIKDARGGVWRNSTLTSTAGDKPKRAELVMACYLIARIFLETDQLVLYKTMRLMHPPILPRVMICLINNTY